MILFCDTSALVKLYLDEADSPLVLDAAQAATALAVCRVAWAEAVAAFARRARDIPADTANLELAQQRLKAHWAQYMVIDASQFVVERAGEYADTFALRVYDAIQLAAARTLQEAATEELRFACFDNRLRKAARVLGMSTCPNA